jgi:hypothetical protein
MEADSPRILHQDNIVKNFVADLGTLASVQNFHLCPLHEDHKTPLLKRIYIGALQDVLLAINQAYKQKKRRKKDKKSQKTQRLQHL